MHHHEIQDLVFIHDQLQGVYAGNEHLYDYVLLLGWDLYFACGEVVVL